MWSQGTRRSLAKANRRRATQSAAWAVVLLAALGLYVSAASSQNTAPLAKRAFHATKDCSGSSGIPGSYCTVRTSNVKALKPGSRIFYLEQSGKATLDSDIVIFVQRGTVANGHCLLHLATGKGLCTISNGTGALAGFHLRVRVTADASIAGLYHWDGTYSFGKG